MFAQPPNITGQYNRSHRGDPQGASALFVLENHRYVITYFGGAQVGKWEINNDLVTLTPFHYPHRYALFGRHNKKLGDSVRVFFSNFDEDETFIRLGAATHDKPVLKRVFNKSANCVPFPSVTTLKSNADSISLSAKPYVDSREDQATTQPVYTFINKEKYNDFVAYYFPQRKEERPMQARIKGNRLYFREDDYSEKGPFRRGEDKEFAEQLSQGDFNPDTVLYNPWYKQCGREVYDTFNYRYDAAKGAYINFLNYTEGEENTKDDESFNRTFIVYPFKNLREFSVQQQQFAIDEKPLFLAKCREEDQ
jgi:hypothetical protein